MYAHKKKGHFAGMELRPEGKGGEKYLSNEAFLSFQAQKTTEIQCFKV